MLLTSMWSKHRFSAGGHMPATSTSACMEAAARSDATRRPGGTQRHGDSTRLLVAVGRGPYQARTSRRPDQPSTRTWSQNECEIDEIRARIRSWGTAAGLIPRSTDRNNSRVYASRRRSANRQPSRVLAVSLPMLPPCGGAADHTTAARRAQRALVPACPSGPTRATHELQFSVQSPPLIDP